MNFWEGFLSSSMELLFFFLYLCYFEGSYFAIMQISCFSLRFCRLILGSKMILACSKYYCGGAEWLGTISTISSAFVNYKSAIKNLVSLLSIFKHYLYLHGLINFYFYIWVKNHYYYYCFFCSKCPHFGLWSPFNVAVILVALQYAD